MRVVYLINQYPKVSHSFIRREILALEGQGVAILRIALRGWDGDLVDEHDINERKQTRYVLRGGAIPLLLAALRMLATRPLRFAQALGLAVKMGRGAERSLPVHLVYLAEACCVLVWIRGAQIDHVHAHFGSNSAEVAMLLRVLGGPPWSFTAHGPEEFDKASSLHLSEKVRRCTFVVAVSSFGRSQLWRLVEPTQWAKVHVVHCGLDEVFTDASAQFSSARRLVCVGRLCEQKGQLLLVEAARLLSATGVEFELVLAGDGEQRGALEAFIARSRLGGKVSITGWISGDRVRDQIVAARALVMPSFAEGLPVVLMEAMALRRPVISTYVAGIPELVVPGEHGWLVPAGDVDALAHAMRTCLDTPVEMLGRMGKAGRQRVLERHCAATESSKLISLFRSSPSNTA